MLCEQVLGKLHDFDTEGKTVEYVDIEWHEAFKNFSFLHNSPPDYVLKYVYLDKKRRQAFPDAIFSHYNEIVAKYN